MEKAKRKKIAIEIKKMVEKYKNGKASLDEIREKEKELE
jgi:hypothetical protein